MTTTEIDRVIHILEHAHRRMDQLGYPPANRTIDGRECHDIAHTFDRLAVQQRGPATVCAAPDRDRESPRRTHR